MVQTKEQRGLHFSLSSSPAPPPSPTSPALIFSTFFQPWLPFFSKKFNTSFSVSPDRIVALGLTKNPWRVREERRLSMKMVTLCKHSSPELAEKL